MRPETTANEARTQEIQTKRQKGSNCRTRTASQEGCISASENREPFRKIESRVARPTNVPKRKSRNVNKGTQSSGREKIEPKYATSPTVSREAVMHTVTIDALEGRDVVAVDIPGAYLSADMDNEVHVVFIGTLEETVVSAYPALYRPSVSYDT